MIDRGPRTVAPRIVLAVGAALLAVAGIAIGLTSGGSGTPEDEKQAIIDRLAATRSAEAQYLVEHLESSPTGNPPTLKPTIAPTSW